MTIKELGIFSIVYNLGKDIPDICDKLHLPKARVYAIAAQARKAGFHLKRFRTSPLPPETIAKLTELLDKG